ncbi:MAG: hypothetical protein HXX16_11210 [Bacteroidales bacterium]|nr:hypothetical protein [Bacteroidales bacterium]
MKQLLVFFLSIFALETKAQWEVIDTTHINDEKIDNIYIPENLEDCFIEFSNPEYKKTREILRKISEDSIDIKFKSVAEFWMNWKFNEVSRFTKYFNQLGIMQPKNMQNIILHTYYRNIHDLPLRIEEELSKYRKIEAQENEEYQKKFLLDSINHVYIPRNIEECFIELDKILKKEDIKTIKELKSSVETINYHFNLGMWIRNNWGLWGGSRLQLYMHERHEDEPDDMSAKILELYWDWLNGIEKNWKKFNGNK